MNVKLKDTPSDLQSAANANVRCNIGSLYGPHKEQELHIFPHDKLIKAPKEIIEIINGVHA